MSTITKEWLESQISAIKAVGITDSNTLQAFEIALASLEAEPAIHRWRRVTFEPYGPYPWHYGNFIGFSKPVDGIEDEYYYAAPPAPVSVPAAMEMDDDFDSAFEHGKAVGWNAYRAAMLQGAEPVKNHDELREKVRREHAEWSQATFGDVGPVGPLKHLSKEALEAAAEPRDLSEWADMQFLLWDAQRRAGICDEQITAALEEKLKVNMTRHWPEPKDGEPRLHIKAAPQQEVTQALAKGMERYGDAMQKLADSGD